MHAKWYTFMSVRAHFINICCVNVDYEVDVDFNPLNWIQTHGVGVGSYSDLADWDWVDLTSSLSTVSEYISELRLILFHWTG